MASKREQALQALFDRLKTVAGATVLRNEVLPEKVPAEGLVILRDGDPGEPDVVLSPLTYHWRHVAEVEAVVSAPVSSERDTALDDLLVAIGDAIAADRTLSGAVDDARAGAPDTRDLAIEGAAGLKGAVVPVTLMYESSDPLG